MRSTHSRPSAAALLLILFALSNVSSAQATGGSAQPALPGQTTGDFVIRGFRFTSGESLPELRLHVLTLGTPHRNSAGQIDNAILLLHSTADRGSIFTAPSFSDNLFGRDQPFDLTRFYIIIPDDIGHGESSKPSDGLRARFPRYGYEDMAAAQHRLVTERLGVTHLRLVLGVSMGAMHTWLWGERYPEMMDALVPISGLPVEIAGRNRLWRRMVVDAIRNDPEWKHGDYEQQPHGYARIVPLIAMMVGNPSRQYEQHPTSANADEWYEQMIHTAYAHSGANDRLYAYDASRDYDPAPGLEAIKARLLLIVFADDQIDSPQFGVLAREMSRVKNGRYAIVPAGSGSSGEGNNLQAGLWRSYLQEFLRRSGDDMRSTCAARARPAVHRSTVACR